jgi:hypothetical protein
VLYKTQVLYNFFLGIPCVDVAGNKRPAVGNAVPFCLPTLVRRGGATRPRDKSRGDGIFAAPSPCSFPFSHELPRFLLSRTPATPLPQRARSSAGATRAMASVAATSMVAPALAARWRRSARAGLSPPSRRAVVRCSLDTSVSDMGVNGEERDPAAGPFLSDPAGLFLGPSVTRFPRTTR